ncbi:hypothetical protein Q5P01_017685 [Channa striata]|uniref:MICAL-like protein 1 n=1 Tax=Channa striata TaxID=64152 RepID=A0AA88SE32_CHASR|nr:hypothetical protein Q5P01_017685 [Channa striata]
MAASPAALRDWCRVTCADYSGVEISNMSSSFRDGLAFCAIIHRHRPDLIHFRSLSKDDAYKNNKLAFEVAETKLGIPALLDPKDVVSCAAPNALSITFYLSQYYHFFNRKSHAGSASLRSPHISLLNNFTNGKSPYGREPLKSQTHLKTSKDHLSNTRPQTVCKLCFKPVYLIQRHVVDGDVCHRSCFRCTVCHSTLLPRLYTQESVAGSLICSHHVTKSKNAHVDFAQKHGSTHNRPKLTLKAGYYSFGGLATTSVPHYTKTTESLDKLVCETANTQVTAGVKSTDREESSLGLKSMVQKPEDVHLPPPSGRDGTVEGARQAGPEPAVADSTLQQEVTDAQQPSSPSDRATKGSGRPVPAPRRMLDSCAGPVPAPRIKTWQRTSSSPAAASASSQCKPSLTSPHMINPTSDRPKVKINHPWLGIIHAGPWTQLPPAPPPVPVLQSKSNLQGPRYRPKVPPPNPFTKEVDEESCNKAAEHEPVEQTKCLVEACHSEGSGTLDSEVLVCSEDAEKTNIKSDNDLKPTEKPIPPKGGDAVSANAVDPSSELPGNTISPLVLDENQGTGDSLSDVCEATAGPQATSHDAQSHILPRRVSVPAFPPALSPSSLEPDGPTVASERVTSCQSEQVCKANPQKLPLSSQQAPAPGHVFPLIKRKTDQNVVTGELQLEMAELEKQLEALEQRGVELEKKLKNCRNDKEEMQMLTEWFSLIHKRHVLVCRDTELVYLSQQQKLEEKQADVEHNLRCLLNKPESDWSPEDQKREKELTNELVAVIEQRDQIIIILDQDRQREKEEDVLWEAMMKSKELQKEGLNTLKKSKGRLKPGKLFKILSHRAESTKNSNGQK